MAAAVALGALLIFAGCDASAELPSADAAASPSQTASSAPEASATEEVTMPSETPDTAQVSEAPAAETISADAAADEALPSPDQQYMTLSLTGQITDIDREQDIYYITEQGGDTSDPTSSVGAVETDDCMILDAQTGREIDDDSLQVGDNVTAYIGYAMSRSIPPQAQCFAILTNVPTDGSGVAYVRALAVSQDNDSIQVLNQNADMFFNIPLNLEIEEFDENGQTVPSSLITEGTRMVVWYGQTTRSIPPQAVATKVVVDLDD